MISVKTKKELITLIENGTDLSTVDTSKITDMSFLFAEREAPVGIEGWDTSNVTDMSLMFFNSKFNSDISQWNTSKVKEFKYMFQNSAFNQDISFWDMSSAFNIKYMFYNSKFNKNLNNWNVKNVMIASGAFYNSDYSYTINKWNLPPLCNVQEIINNIDKSFLPPMLKFAIPETLDNYIVDNITLLPKHSDSELLKFLSVDGKKVMIKKKYNYYGCEYSLKLPNSILEKINTLSYLPRFITEDLNYYYFKNIDGDEPEEDEITDLVQQIKVDFPNVWHTMIPTADETENYIKDADGNYFVKDIDFVFNDYITINKL